MRYLALGDSYTCGEQVSAGESWPVQLAALLRRHGAAVADPQMVARTGWTTSELSAGLDQAAPSGRFDLVSLLIGVNDQYRSGKVEAYRLGFRALLREHMERRRDNGRLLWNLLMLQLWQSRHFGGGDLL